MTTIKISLCYAVYINLRAGCANIKESDEIPFVMRLFDKIKLFLRGKDCLKNKVDPVLKTFISKFRR